MIYLVTYDLNGPTEGYTALFEALKSQGDSWWHYLRNTWLISTYKSPEQIFAAIKPYMNEQDRFLIVKFSAPYHGWLAKDAWEWIRKYRDSPGIPTGQSSTPSLFPPDTLQNREKNVE